jgi:hypothetical protein
MYREETLPSDFILLRSLHVSLPAMAQTCSWYILLCCHVHPVMQIEYTEYTTLCYANPAAQHNAVDRYAMQYAEPHHSPTLPQICRVHEKHRGLDLMLPSSLGCRNETTLCQSPWLDLSYSAQPHIYRYKLAQLHMSLSRVVSIIPSTYQPAWPVDPRLQNRLTV